MTPTPAQLPKRVAATLEGAEVVLVVSPVTDDRFIHDLLRKQGLAAQRVEYSMASHADRAEFDQLREATGWKTLPQIFVNGRFIGGVSELLEMLDSSKA
jgi:glutaredoxin-related protein